MNMRFETMLPLLGVVVGWGLKTISDYFVTKRDDMRRYRIATFYLLRAYKSLMDYERATRYFRQDKPTVEEFEPWRAILEQRLRESLEIDADTTAKAVETLSSVDPPLESTTQSRIYCSRSEKT